MVEVEEKADLLNILDGLVKRDGPATGLRGEVCIGIRGDAGYRWWSADFWPTFGTAFLDRPSETARVTLFLAESDADALLRTGKIPKEPELLMIDGDKALLISFIERYTSRTNWLGIRLGRG